MTTIPAARIRTAALNAAGTTLYYATPDLVRRRGARAVAKTAIVAGLGALAVADYVATESEPEREGREQMRALWSERSPGEKVFAVAAGLAVGGAALAGVVAAERGIFRAGERRSAAGVRFGHLRGAMVMGLLTGALALVPPGAPAADD